MLEPTHSVFRLYNTKRTLERIKNREKNESANLTPYPKKDKSGQKGVSYPSLENLMGFNDAKAGARNFAKVAA